MEVIHYREKYGLEPRPQRRCEDCGVEVVGNVTRCATHNHPRKRRAMQRYLWTRLLCQAIDEARRTAND
jgi:hypothetical protein